MTPELEELFGRQSRVDQVHAMRVAARLLAHGWHDRDLIVAALLHDVGKIGARLNLFDRILWVALTRAAPTTIPIAARWMGPKWVILARHQSIGAALSRKAGASSTACALIEHDSAACPADLAAALVRADETV